MATKAATAKVSPSHRSVGRAEYVVTCKAAVAFRVVIGPSSRKGSSNSSRDSNNTRTSSNSHPTLPEGNLRINFSRFSSSYLLASELVVRD